MIGRLLAIAGGAFADAVRRRVVLIVLVFAAVLSLAIPSLPTYGLGVVSAVYREVGLALSYLTALVLTLALAANRIPGEIERRTAYSVVARPVHRWEYLAGTWAGIVAVVGAALAAFTVVLQLWGQVRYGAPMWVLWQGALGIWFEMAVIAALCVAVSAVAGATVTSVSALAFVFVGHTRDAVLGESSPGWLRAIYPSLDTFNIVNPVAHGSGVSAAYVGSMIVAFVAMSALVLLLGAIAFGRRDL
jgi:ABC-type transport system involved in multi-copper enzyme maturation permease subunit